MKPLGTAIEAILIDTNGAERHVEFAPRTRLSYSGRKLELRGPELEDLAGVLPGRIKAIAYQHADEPPPALPRKHSFGRRGARIDAGRGCVAITGVRVAPFIAD